MIENGTIGQEMKITGDYGKTKFELEAEYKAAGGNIEELMEAFGNEYQTYIEHSNLEFTV